MLDLTPCDHREKNMMRALDRWGENFFRDMESDLWDCKTDIQDKGDCFLLEAELPGFEKEDIKINLEGNYLTIRAEHNEKKEEKDKKGSYIRRERYSGTYERSFDVSGIQTDAIQARCV